MDLLKISYVISLNIIGKKMMQTDKGKRHQKNRKSIFDINIIDQNNKTTKISNRRLKNKTIIKPNLEFRYAGNSLPER